MCKVAAMRFALASLLTLAVGPALAAGALAIDGNQGLSYGWAVDLSTPEQAAQEALFQCGSGCRVVLRFDSGCGAYAADQSPMSTISGWGGASSGPAAQDRALSECLSRGGRNCIVRAWVCHKPAIPR